MLVHGDLPAEASYEINLFADLGRTPTAFGASAGGGTLATAGSHQTAYRARALSRDVWQDGFVSGRVGVDRMRLRLPLDRLDINLGRFPINPSVTYVVAPNDFFAPFSATAINTVYKPGVDAAQVSLGLGALSVLEVTAVLGYDDESTPRWRRSALLLRASAVLLDIEWAVLAAKLADRCVAGGSVQGEMGPVGVRAEGHVGVAIEDGDGPARSRHPHLRLAAGLERVFAWSNFAIAAEYAYFSDGAPHPRKYLKRLQRLYSDDHPYMGQHYASFTVAGDIIPILRGAAVIMVNAADRSGLGVLSGTYSIADEADFAAGLLAPWGETPVVDLRAGSLSIDSEFGSYPRVLFFETRFYF